MGKVDGKLMSQWICGIVNRHPDRIAIIHGDRKITYAELYDSIQRLAGALATLGVQRGDRIVLLLNNSPEFIIGFFAIINVKAIAVPLNVQYKEQELTTYIKDSEPKIIIASDMIIPLLRKITPYSNNRNCTFIGMPDGKDGVLSLTSLMGGNSPLNNTPDLSLQDEVLFQYSSGSTGQPKRIIRNHLNLVSEAENYCSTVDMTSDDNILCVIPLFHSHGFGNCMLASNYAGATLILMDDFNRRRVLEKIQEEQVTVFPGVPFMFNMLADTNLKEEMTHPSLRLCFSAGAPLIQSTVRKFYEKYGVFIRQLYGSTETGSISINLDENLFDTAESVGLPMKNVDVEIFGMNGEILKPEEIGDVGIRSPGMINGYSELEKLNVEAFRDGYFFPGDLGKKDKRRNLYITGRKTLFINTAGNKVDPLEIEKILVSHPKVEEVVVVGIKSNYGDEIIKAVIVLNCQCDENELIDFCRGKIAEFKIPRIIEFREEIPKSPIGKILRKYLC
ncbi:MAG: acyl--CoA ligase [Planctomycetes bacterium]|nr:acyl--CoA ligase [Planctomycetota bacterium]